MIKESKLEQFKKLKYKINDEGFHYLFIHYSRFEDINDKKFHKLRKRYIKASKELEEYIDQRIS